MDWMRAMSPDWLQAIFTVLCVFVAGGVAWGVERQARKDLESRHALLATEVRSSLQESKEDRTKLAEQLGEAQRSLSTFQERVANLTQQLEKKASAEAVDSLREALGRIDGKLDSLTMAIARMGENRG